MTKVRELIRGTIMSSFEDAMAAIAAKAGVEYEKKVEPLPPPKIDPNDDDVSDMDTLKLQREVRYLRDVVRVLNMGRGAHIQAEEENKRLRQELLKLKANNH